MGGGDDDPASPPTTGFLQKTTGGVETRPVTLHKKRDSQSLVLTTGSSVTEETIHTGLLHRSEGNTQSTPRFK